jgi:SAM-dependent methyltransferase
MSFLVARLRFPESLLIFFKPFLGRVFKFWKPLIFEPKVWLRMNHISPEALASIEFRVSFEHEGVRHTDCRYAPRVNLWRDLLPRKLYNGLMGKQRGDRVVIDFQPEEIVAPRDRKKIFEVPHHRLDESLMARFSIQPRFGRFYPCGLLKDVPGIFRQNRAPFRCVGSNGANLTADLNHSLAGRTLCVEAHVADVREKFDERGGTAVDWVEVALEGSGMQARVNGTATDFFSDDPFARADEGNDQLFYRKPRLVKHIDDRAIEVIRGLYGKLIRPDSDVLDLMSSWISHVPEDLQLKSLTGLGMNADELRANRRLTDHVVHDLNQNACLPFDANSFDAVICTVSVEYLTRPFEVFENLARVLKPGGLLVYTVSNRWFAPKVIRIWPQLHEFERLGLILEYFLASGLYCDVQTYSLRGLPRPEHDPYYGEFLESDPVYAVWGRSCE